MPQRGRSNADDLLLMALACGATWEAAANRAGGSRPTVQRRMKNPEFCPRLQEVKADIVKRNSAGVYAASGEAIKTLVSLLPSGNPHTARLGAARTILETGMRMHEVIDLEQRLAGLEAQLALKP